MTDIIVRLNMDSAIEPVDFIPMLKAMAQEIQLLNNFVDGDKFPRPIKSNPDAMTWVEEHTEVVPEHVDTDGNTVPETTVTITAHWTGSIEGFCGDLNTPPDINGFITVRLADYDFFDLRILDSLPAKPATFSFGYAQTGQFVK